MKSMIEKAFSIKALVALMVICATGGAWAVQLGDGITAYYDCETSGSSAKAITVAGTKWDSSSGALVSDGALLLGWDGGGIGHRGGNGQKFSNCYSGGGTGARCYESQVCAGLCPGTSSGDWTFSFWVVRNNATTQRRLFVNSQNALSSYTASDITGTSAANTGFGIYLESNGKVGVRLSETTDGSAFNVVSIVSSSSYTWNTSTWHNVIVSRSGDTLTLYVDGAVAGTAAMTTGSYIVDPSCLTMAEGSSGGIGQENGADDFCVWNRALTSYERGAIVMGTSPISALAGQTAQSYVFSNADGSALRWDGGYNNNSGSISFTLSNPGGVHAASGFPKSGLVALTCISISSRKDGNNSTLDHVVITAANGKSYISSSVEILDGDSNAANIFTTTLASGGAYGATGSYGQGGGRKTINIYFDSVAVDVTSALTLATYTSADATGQLGSSVVASTTTGTDWKPAMRIYGEDLTTTPVTRTIAENADVSWADAAWTVGGEASQSFSPSSDTAYDVTITVNGDCTIAMPSSIGLFTGCNIKFELGNNVASANVSLVYPETALGESSAETTHINPFGTAAVSAGSGITLTPRYGGNASGYKTLALGYDLYLAKRPSVGVVSVRIGARTESASGGYIAPTYANVGPYPMSGIFWNQTKFWNSDSTSGNYTDIQNLTDAENDSSAIRIGYYGHNTYYNTNKGNDASTPNRVLTATYLDDSDSGNGDLTATASVGDETITLPTPGHNRGWQLHFENIPYSAYDVYFVTASDVDSGLKECPIYVSLDGGTTWKSYMGDSVNEKTVMGTDSWTGLHYAVGGNLVHGKNYIKMRITKSIYGDNIGTIDITHGVRNTGSKIRSGLAAIQIVEVENDGVYTLNSAGDWSDNIWDVGALTGQNWTDTVDGEASIAKIESSATIDSVTVDTPVSAGSVVLTGSDPFIVAGSSTLTVETGFDASAFTGALNLQAPITGTIYIGASTSLQFGGNSDMTLPAYTLDGAGSWTKIGTGVLTVNNALSRPGTVTGGAVDFTSSTTGNITLNGGNLKFTGDESEILYDGTVTLANNGTGKTIIESGTVQSRGNISTDIDVNNGAVLKLGNAAGFGSSGAAPSGKTITVNSGGVIELNGYEGCNAYTLNGGTLRNTGTALDSGHRQTMGLTLTANSTVHAGSEFGLVNSNHGSLSVALGGYKLTKTGSSNFILSNTTISGTSGSEISVEDGTLNFVNTGSTVNVPVSVAASKTVQVDVASEIQSISGAGSVSGSAMLTTSGLDLSDGLTVATPVTLKNGATVTLGAGSITGAITIPNSATVTFDASGLTLSTASVDLVANLTIGDGATVTVTGLNSAYNYVVDPENNKIRAYTIAAKIGDTPYETIADAVSEAAENDEIDLLVDTMISSSISKSLTIDLNGHSAYSTSGTQPNVTVINSSGTAAQLLVVLTSSEVSTLASGESIILAKAASTSLVSANGYQASMHDIVGSNVVLSYAAVRTSPSAAGYVSLSAAVAAVPEDEVTSIKVLKEATIDSALTIPSYVTVDANNKNITVSGAVTVNGTLNMGTGALSYGSLSGATTGEIIYSGKMPDGSGWTVNSWNGTVTIVGATGNYQRDLHSWGRNGSKIKVTELGGYTYIGTTINAEVIFENGDGENSYAINFGNGWSYQNDSSSNYTIFRKISGHGLVKDFGGGTNGAYPSQLMVFCNADDFDGSLSTGGRIYCFSANPNFSGTAAERPIAQEGAAATIQVAKDGTAYIGDGESWTATGGIKLLGGNAKVVLKGNATFTGATTIANGSTIQFNAVSLLTMGDITVAAGDTVNIVFGTGVEPAPGTKIISWTAKPAGSFSANVLAKSDGLYVAPVAPTDSESASAGTIEIKNDKITAVLSDTSDTVTIPAGVEAVEMFVTGGSTTISTTAITPSASTVTIYATNGSGVKDTTYNITGAFKFVNNGDGTWTIELNDADNAAVDGVKIKPECAAATPMAMSGNAPVLSIKTIPGLWYSTYSTTSVDANGALSGDVSKVTPQQAESQTTNFSAGTALGDEETVRYYKVVVGPSKASVQ